MTGSGSSLQPQVDAFLHYLRVERQLSAKTQEVHSQAKRTKNVMYTDIYY